MPEPRRVLVVFSDKSLGGTSRSALTTGAAWRTAGAVVDFCALRGIHPERLDDFLALGSVHEAAEVDALAYDLVHHHHGHLQEADRDALRTWSAQVAAAEPSARPALLTHNVFGVPDHPTEAWPGPAAVGVLGEWLELQYRASRWPRPVPPVVVVPNPQDFSFFRAPSPEERSAARARFGLAPGLPVALRVGSPHRDKWSPTYLALAAAAAGAGVRLICVGTPPELAARLAERGDVDLLPSSGDAELLRDLYWAADVLAVDAKQGESFGNVLLEAVGCGTPAVYRDRPTRDDTPREFPVLVSVGAGRWVRDVIDVATGRRDAPAATPEALRRYSIEGVATVLGALLAGRLSPAAVAAVARPDVPRRPTDRIAVAVRHLPPGRWALALARAGRRLLQARRRPAAA